MFRYSFSEAIPIYKITKIVRAPWLAERSVYMRACKHGCDVKMFCFSRANHASTNLKKFLSSKLDTFTLFAHSFVGWNLGPNPTNPSRAYIRLCKHGKRFVLLKYFSVALKVILSLSDRYKVFTNDWLQIEMCQYVGFSKIDITMTTIKKLWNW